MNRILSRRLFCSLLIVLFLSVSSFPTLAQTLESNKQSESKSRIAKLGFLVVVGDSLSAGFQNGSLLDRQQRNGYAAVVARQARTPLIQPLIAAPGIPNVLTLVSPGPPPIIVPAPGVSTGRDNSFLPVTNLAVPGANLRDTLVTRPNLPIDSLTDLVLGVPVVYFGISKSQVEFAELLRPQTLIVWIGNNDALGAALSGDATRLTPLAQFQADYTELINRLAATRAKLIVANIPDVTTTAYLISAEDIAAQIGLPLAIIGPILGIRAGEYVTPSALPLIPGILANPSTGPLPPNVILDTAEVATVRTAVNNYNAFIAEKVAEKSGVLVDTNALIGNIDANGYPLGDGRVLTTNFLGGLYSLDGVHPTNTGYAIIANEFIRKINARYNSNISLVNILAVANADPLVPGNSLVAAPTTTISEDAAKNLQTVFKLDK